MNLLAMINTDIYLTKETAMKYLKDQLTEREEGEVMMMVKTITTSKQAHLLEMGALPGVENRAALTEYCLRNLVHKIVINAVEYNPAYLATMSDLSDADTLAVYLKIGRMVCDVAFPPAEDLKKL